MRGGRGHDDPPARGAGRRALALGALWAASLLTARAKGEGPDARPGDDDELTVEVQGDKVEGYRAVAMARDAPREPIDAGALLAPLPSVHVRRLGGDDGFSVLSIRGAGSTQVGVVLAGVPLTSAADPSLDLASLPLWPGIALRVHRSFAPPSLGTTGHLGGVLEIPAPTIREGGATELWGGVGSFGGVKARGADVRRVGALSFATAVFGSRADGDYPYTTDDPSTGGRVERVRTNNAHLAGGLLERVELDGARGGAGATVLLQARRQGLAGTALFPTTRASLETTRLVVAADGRLRTGEPEQGGAPGAWHAAAWGRRETTRFADPLGELDPTRPGALVKSETLAAGASLGYRVALRGGGVMHLLVDGRREALEPIARAERSPTLAATRLAAGAGGEVRHRAGRVVTLGAAARLDARHDRAEGGPGGSGLEPSGHAGASVRLSPLAVVAAHAGALARPPSFLELFGDRGALLGDPDLAVERALAADLGISGHAPFGPGRARYELVAFGSLARDLITFVPYGRGTLRATNVDRALLGGGEAAFSVAPARAARTTLSYTLLWTKNLGRDPLAHGKPLPGRPRHDLAADFSLRLGVIRLRYGLDALAGMTSDVRGAIPLPARVLHGAGASLEPLRGVRAGLEIQNLFDLRSAYIDSPATGAPVRVAATDHLGFPSPGRTVWATLTLRLDGGGSAGDESPPIGAASAGAGGDGARPGASRSEGSRGEGAERAAARGVERSPRSKPVRASHPGSS